MYEGKFKKLFFFGTISPFLVVLCYLFLPPRPRGVADHAVHNTMVVGPHSNRQLRPQVSHLSSPGSLPGIPGLPYIDANTPKHHNQKKGQKASPKTSATTTTNLAPLDVGDGMARKPLPRSPRCSNYLRIGRWPEPPTSEGGERTWSPPQV